MTLKNLKVMASVFCAATLSWGQAVPSQIADIQLGSKGGSQGGNNIQINYNVDGKGVNKSSAGLIQFDLSGFPTNLSPSGIEKASVVLFVQKGGNAGTFSVCQAGQAWSTATITGANAPACSGLAPKVVSVSSATLQNGGFITIDVTPFAQNWYSAGNAGNFGIILTPDAPSAGDGKDGINVQLDSVQGNGYPPLLNLILQSQGPAGPQGTTGLTGLTGAVGPQGPQGAAGPQGAIGPIGLAGAIGPIGLQGQQGPIGLQGSQGSPGPQGSAGPIGLTGAIGPIGPQGQQGLIGPIGLAGAIGPIGPQGLQGSAGPQGPMGLQGATGAQGAQGAQGPQGPAGPSPTTPNPNFADAITAQIEPILSTDLAYVEVTTLLTYPYSVNLTGVLTVSGTAPTSFAEDISSQICPDNSGHCRQVFRLSFPYLTCVWNNAQYTLTFGYNVPNLSAVQSTITLNSNNWCQSFGVNTAPPAPVVSSINPTVAARDSLFTLTVTGLNLNLNGDVPVWINFANLLFIPTLNNVTATTLSYVVPAEATDHLVGPIAISVQTGGGVSNTILLPLTP
jgi:hypothetical protein